MAGHVKASVFFFQCMKSPVPEPASLSTSRHCVESWVRLPVAEYGYEICASAEY